jgi:hypothetical protein
MRGRPWPLHLGHRTSRSATRPEASGSRGFTRKSANDLSTNDEGPLRVALAAALLRTAECLGTVGYGDDSAVREGSDASLDRPGCVADHTRDDLWVILSSGETDAT